MAIFFAALAALTLIRILTALVPAPVGWLPALSVATTIVFVAVPIFALFRAASGRWTPKIAVAFLLGGLTVHLGLVAATSAIGHNLAGRTLLALSQVGLISWCVGLGALLATLLKDKNLLIPVTIFLGCFDLFLVFTPIGPTRLIMQAAPNLLPTVGYAIPTIVTAPTAAPVAPYAVVGPADFIFMAMFFISLFRFNMRAKQTFYALVPTLLAYLVLSAFLGAIPLLPPIAVVVLLVNIREFHMNKEEKLSTVLIAVICVGLVVWGATRPKPLPEPSPAASDPAHPRLAR